jgi:hypothetical protein
MQLSFARVRVHASSVLIYVLTLYAALHDVQAKHEAPVVAIALSADGLRIAVGTAGG